MKGQRSFQILAPMVKTITETKGGEERKRSFVFGFKSTAVFGLSQTEGDDLPPPDPAVMEWLDRLPLVDVAKSWGLSVDAFNGQGGKYLGWYRRGDAIALGVKNLSTWAHEFIHAADDRLGTLTERGQHWRSEVVAELGGSILLEVLGHDMESDRGGCWDYVNRYAKDAGLEAIQACQRVLKRACDGVALIIDSAEQLANEPEGGAA